MQNFPRIQYWVHQNYRKRFVFRRVIQNIKGEPNRGTFFETACVCVCVTSGGSAIPGAVVGILMGGYCLRQFQLTRKGKPLPRSVASTGLAAWISS